MYQKLLAFSTFCGTIIGVGLFGLPYVTARVGFLPMIFYFLILGVVMLLVNLAYGEIVLRTAGDHRLPGYNRIYLRRPWLERLSYVTTVVGLVGSLLAYLVVGGSFLSSLAAPYLGGNTLVYTTLFFIIGSLIVAVGSGPVSKTTLVSLTVFFAVLVLLLATALPRINLSYLTSSRLNFDNLFMPYGVILFSLAGASVIPDLKEMLKNQERSLRSVIIIGSIVPIIAYLIFIITVYGVTGPQTTEEALGGLSRSLGGSVATLGLIFGIMTTFDSFLALGINLKKEFQYDGGLRPVLAGTLACLPAYLLYLFGVTDFIGIISFIGAVALGIDTIITMMIYPKAKTHGQRTPAYSLNLPKPIIITLTVLFLLGVGIELAHLLIP